MGTRYSSNIVLIAFGITVLLAVSNQYVEEFLPKPKPRDPPNQAKQYIDGLADQRMYWACAEKGTLYMRWADRYHRKNQSDLWFDRLVYIHHEGRYSKTIKEYTQYKNGSTKEIQDLSITLNGIILDYDRILTSYNPFRQIIKYTFKRHFTHVCALSERKMGENRNDSRTRFRISYNKIACARQVVPVKESETSIDLWHGVSRKGVFIKQHSPLHDLMVIRIDGFISNMTKDNYDFDFISKYTKDFYVSGPQRTYLAKEYDPLGRNVKFAMIGHIFGVQYDVIARRDTFVASFNTSNVVVDCDEWIPREWGRFICLLNKSGLKRLASGAALYSRRLLFGIGSFTLFKGDRSILVFTDVRPYESLISDSVTGPCTTTDQFGKKPMKPSM